MIKLFLVLLVGLSSVILFAHDKLPADVSHPVVRLSSGKFNDYENRLKLPPLVMGPASPGKRVKIIPPEYEGTEVHHILYLPVDWDENWKKKGRSWPVIVEYTGNKYPTSGSTGKVEDAALGYGLSGGKFIWVVLPFVATDYKHNEVTWWGDEKATVDYAKINVPRICANFGGDSGKVFICGFSRGAIAVNYIGLYDDEIAKLWCGFITHDHYDGVREWKNTVWGSPLSRYRESAFNRLKRLANKPVLICQNESTLEIQSYLKDFKNFADFTFFDIPVNKIFPEIPNPLMIHPHTDRWLFVNSDSRRKVWQWMNSVLSTLETNNFKNK